MRTKTYSFGKFECRGSELLLREPTLEESVDGGPLILGVVRSLLVACQSGTWVVSPLCDEDDPVYPVEVILRHEDAPSSGIEASLRHPLWIRTGRLAVFDAVRVSDLRTTYTTHAGRSDYVANEHDRVLEGGLIVSMGSSVAVPVFVEQRDGRAVAIRIHNPWHAILLQRLRNRMMDHFEVASWSDLQRQHGASAWLIDWMPLEGIDAEAEFPGPAYSRAERDAILEYDRAWNEAAVGIDLPSVPKIIDTPFWQKLRPAAEKAFAVFQVRGTLPEDVEFSEM